MRHTAPIMKVNFAALKYNLNQFYYYLKPETKLMIMIKGFASGTGSVPTARWIEKTGLASYFATPYVSEGVELRRIGHISLPIMIMMVSDLQFNECRQFNLEPVIYSIHILDMLIEFLDTLESKTNVHTVRVVDFLV